MEPVCCRGVFAMFLFNISINDLEKEVNSTLMKFTNDNKPGGLQMSERIAIV